jgi:hypothetical protein
MCIYVNRDYFLKHFYYNLLIFVMVKRMVVPWLRSLVAGLSLRRPGFAPGSIHVGFVVDKVALGQALLGVLRFSPVNIIPPSLSKLISYGECVIC